MNCTNPSRAQSPPPSTLAAAPQVGVLPAPPAALGTPPSFLTTPAETDDQIFIVVPVDHGCCIKHSGQCPAAAGDPALSAGILLAGEGTMASCRQRSLCYPRASTSTQGLQKPLPWRLQHGPGFPAVRTPFYAPACPRQGPLPRLGASCAVPSPAEHVPAAACWAAVPPHTSPTSPRAAGDAPHGSVGGPLRKERPSPVKSGMGALS